ncbi:MAG TPA: WD40 repeat domain-containing protein, partial [Pseudomonadota bacterium]|nr:WD40 repeat domain-containing protein [Pseudomonadota bacterium]
KTLSTGGDLTSALVFSVDGTRLYSAGFDFAGRSFDAKSGRPAEQTLQGHSGAIWGMGLSSDGKRLCTASQDQTVRIWELGSGRTQTMLQGHSRAVTDCRFLPDGEHVLSSSEDKTLRLWDLATGKTQGEPLRGHVDRITGIAVSRDGLRAVSASEDQTLRLWDLTTLQSIGPGLRGHVRSISAVGLSPNSQRAYSVSHDGTLRVWDLAVSSWLALACRLAGRDLNREERERFLGDVKLPPLCQTDESGPIESMVGSATPSLPSAAK